MSRDDLKSFKISEQVKQPVERPRAPRDKEPAAAPPSVGFPRIEAIVEATTPDLSGLEERAARLHDLAKSGSNKDKAAAKKAAAAYDKARALLQYLLDTKKRLAGG